MKIISEMIIKINKLTDIERFHRFEIINESSLCKSQQYVAHAMTIEVEFHG